MDVRRNSAHDMNLDPIMLLFYNPLVVVKPAGEVASSKAGRVRRKISFHGFERQDALDNQFFKHRSQFWPLQVVGDAIEVRNLKNESTPLRPSQVTHKSASGNRGIDFESDTKNRIGQGEREDARTLAERL